jgi:hypothetical protein
MSLHLKFTRMLGFCWAAGGFLGLTVQPQAQTAVPQNSLSKNQKQSMRSVVEIPAVNYSLGDNKKVEFSPTALMPGAIGQGEVKASKDGSVSVDVQFTGVGNPTKFGNEFLTYVLWGSVPKGRTLKIGELTLKGDHGQVVAKTVLRTFAMMVTAEPYAAVAYPSSVVVLKAAPSANTTTQTPPAQIELLNNAYAPPGYKYEPLDTSSGYPSEVIQAMNARRIAQVAGAEKYAPEKFRAAESLYQLMTAVAIHEKKISKQNLGVAKSAAQGFEDAREMAVSNQRKSGKNLTNPAMH